MRDTWRFWEGVRKIGRKKGLRNRRKKKGSHEGAWMRRDVVAWLTKWWEMLLLILFCSIIVWAKEPKKFLNIYHALYSSVCHYHHHHHLLAGLGLFSSSNSINKKCRSHSQRLSIISWVSPNCPAASTWYLISSSFSGNKTTVKIRDCCILAGGPSRLCTSLVYCNYWYYYTKTTHKLGYSML